MQDLIPTSAPALGTEKRMDILPNIQTFPEQGIKIYPRINRGGGGAQGHPGGIATKLEKAFLETVNMPEYHSKILKAGFVPMGLNGQQAAKYIAGETETFKKLLTEHNLLLKK